MDAKWWPCSRGSPGIFAACFRGLGQMETMSIGVLQTVPALALDRLMLPQGLQQGMTRSYEPSHHVVSGVEHPAW